MLNELYQAASTDSLRNLFVEEFDKRLKTLPNVSEKNPAFRITLNKKLNDKEWLELNISPISKGQASFLRKFEVSNGLSFPAFNMPGYLMITKETAERLYAMETNPELVGAPENLNEKVTEKHLNRVFKEYFNADRFRNFLESGSEKFFFDDWQRNALSNTTSKISKCLKDVSADLWKQMGTPSGEWESLESLYHKVQRIEVKDFRKAVFECVLHKVQSLSDWEVYYPLLVLSGKATKSVPGVSVVLDMECGEYPVAHEETFRWINYKLLNTAKQDDKISPEKPFLTTDAFGNNTDGSDDKMPSVSLPALGKVILRSMVKESPCQYRYGKVDSSSFVIGNESRRLLKVALETLTQEKFRGKTWNTLPGKEIFIAYPSELPKLTTEMPLVNLFVEYDKHYSVESARQEEFTFPALAKIVIDYLKSINKPLSRIEIRVFALKKMDTARTKVVYYHYVTAEALQKAAETWEKASKNIPDMSLYMWGKSKGERSKLDVITPFPTSSESVINRIWGHNFVVLGTAKETRNTDVIDLFLGALDKNGKSVMLQRLVKNSSQFMLAMGQALHANNTLRYDTQHLYITTPVMYGILLAALGQEKEIYMKTSAYLLGNLLAEMDSLHFLYCKYVRTSPDDRDKKHIINVPAQLIGNAFMAQVAESPIRIFKALMQRSRPYLAWAKTKAYQVSDESDKRWLASIKRNCEEIAVYIAERGIPSQPLSNEECAMLFLGYIAGPAKRTSEKNNSVTTKDTSDKEEK